MVRATEVAPTALVARRHRRAQLQASTILLRVGAAIVLLVALVQARTFLSTTFARAAFPFDDNIWSDQPLMLQLWRFANGGPLYRPMSFIDSYDYGPLYLLVLSAIRGILHLPVSIVAFRRISVALGFLSVVPLVAFAASTARRSGITRANPMQYAIVLIGTGALAVATVTRSWTLDGLHPDSLLLLLLALALWVYGEIIGRRFASDVYSWPLLVVCVAAVLTKLNAAIVFPFLVVGLLASKAISIRFAMVLWVTYAVATLGILFALPHDMKMWTVLAPLRQPYQPERFGELLMTFFVYKSYCAGLVLGGIVAVLALRWRGKPADDEQGFLRHDTFLRNLVVDGVVIGSTLIAGLVAFLKRGGGYHDLVIVAFVCTPYIAVLLARMWEPLGVRRTFVGFRIAAFAAMLLAIIGFAAPGRVAPSTENYDQMNAVQAEAKAVCASHVTTLVTIFPSLFFGCSNVVFAPIVSWGEVRNSYWDPGLLRTVLDGDPKVPQIAWIDYDAMVAVPWHPWLTKKYRLIKSLPAPFGYGNELYVPNARFNIYRRMSAKEQAAAAKAHPKASSPPVPARAPAERGGTRPETAKSRQNENVKTSAAPSKPSPKP